MACIIFSITISDDKRNCNFQPKNGGGNRSMENIGL